MKDSPLQKNQGTHQDQKSNTQRKDAWQMQIRRVTDSATLSIKTCHSEKSGAPAKDFHCLFG
jgi:hypothetical protein